MTLKGRKAILGIQIPHWLWSHDSLRCALVPSLLVMGLFGVGKSDLTFYGKVWQQVRCEPVQTPQNEGQDCPIRKHRAFPGAFLAWTHLWIGGQKWPSGQPSQMHWEFSPSRIQTGHVIAPLVFCSFPCVLNKHIQAAFHDLLLIGILRINF